MKLISLIISDSIFPRTVWEAHHHRLLLEAVQSFVTDKSYSFISVSVRRLSSLWLVLLGFPVDLRSWHQWSRSGPDILCGNRCLWQSGGGGTETRGQHPACHREEQGTVDGFSLRVLQGSLFALSADCSFHGSSSYPASLKQPFEGPRGGGLEGVSDLQPCCGNKQTSWSEVTLTEVILWPARVCRKRTYNARDSCVAPLISETWDMEAASWDWSELFCLL